MFKKLIFITLLLLAAIVFINEVQLSIYEKGYNDGYAEGHEIAQKEVIARRDTSSVFYDTLWGLINNYKNEKGLRQLKMDKLLCDYADIRSKEIITDWSHSGLFKSGNLKFIKYCVGCTRIGEDLAKNYLNSAEVFEAWMNSPSHKEQLDINYTKGCIKAAEDIRGYYYVALIMAY